MLKKNRFSVFLVFVVSVFSLLPIFLLPQFNSPLITSKTLLLFGLTLVSIFTYFILSLKKGRWTLSLNPLLVPALALIATILTSSLINYQYPAQQLLGMGGIYLSTAFLLIFLPNLLSKGDSYKLITPLNIIAGLLSILSIFQVFGIGLGTLFEQIGVYNIPNNLSFSLTGSSLLAVALLSSVLLANLLDKKLFKTSLISQLVVFLSLIAIALNVWATFFNKETAIKLLPLNASLSVANNSLALSRTALFGIGPDSYGYAYNQLKPIWINGQDFWQFSFSSAINQPLTLIVSAGLLAFIAWFFLIWQSVKLLIEKELAEDKENSNRYLAVFVLVMLSWLFFMPASVLSLALIAIALAFLLAENKHHYKEFSFSSKRLLSVVTENKAHKARKSLFSLFSILALLFTTWVSVFVVNNFAATAKVRQASNNLFNNQVGAAFEQMQQAEALNRFSPIIRRDLSSLNLELAMAISNKVELSAAEQEQVMQLLNQAVNEANAAILLNPYDYQNYLALANIYLQLLEISDEAVTAAYENLAKAATYNPNDPNIRIQLGQLMFGQEKYEEAAAFFTQAVERKTDLAAAHYWQAKSLEALKQYEEAQTAYLKSLTLLEKDSDDYKQVNEEYEAIKKVAEEAALQAQQQNQQQTPEAKSTETVPAPEKEASDIESVIPRSSGLSDLINSEEAEELVNEEQTELPME